MSRTLRCTVQYDGAAFAGFQRQPGRTTVQGVLEDAVARITQARVTVVGAGRTDAGVHALGQVVHFQTASALSVAELQRAINACLPDTVAIRALEEAPEGFHARFSARSREYRYVVENSPIRSPLWRTRAYHQPRALSTEAMARAAQALLGRHDFAAFGSPMEHTMRDDEQAEDTRVRGGTMRTMLAARCWRVKRFVLFCFVADAFLRRMVRLMVGTLLRVGLGSLSREIVADMLAGSRTIAAGPVAPAHGLYLVRVRYA